ncbi:MAG: cupredoxin family protein [Gammaproteobacteria bacterium]|nr:cupredoxin family protein [Gammaproteobacteria bacterium]
MKKIFSILILGAWSALALAGGKHAGGHDDDHAMAYGVPGEAAQVSRTIEVQAADNMRYTPAAITVRRGETVKFVVKNTGKLPHEFVLGNAQSLKEHAEMMRRYPDMEHDDPNMAKVAPGGTGTLIWKFTRAGTVDFACLIPGHYEAGMKGRIRVNAK